MITFALMVGTAGLPHIIIRFFTTPTIKGARSSAGWALFFIALLYTTAPAVAAFARLNMINTVHNTSYCRPAGWVKNWEKTGLIAWTDKNGDGKMQYGKGVAFKGGKPAFAKDAGGKPARGDRGSSRPPTRQAAKRAVHRQRHHGAGQPRDRQAPRLGRRPGRRRRPRRGALDGRRPAARHRLGLLPRPDQERHPRA